MQRNPNSLHNCLSIMSNFIPRIAHNAYDKQNNPNAFHNVSNGFPIYYTTNLIMSNAIPTHCTQFNSIALPNYAYQCILIPMHCTTMHSISNPISMHCTTMLIISNAIPMHAQLYLS